MQVSAELLGAMDQTADLVPLLIAAGVVVLMLFGAGHMAGRAVSRFALASRASKRFAAVSRRVVQWAFTLLGLLIALQIMGLTAIAGSLLATGGLLAVILGFAFRSIGENLLAGVFLGVSRSFDVGDLIESSGHTGVVRDVNLRSVHIRAADGRDIFIPCAQIFSGVLVNYTRGGLRRGDFVIGVDYGHDAEEVRRILLNELRRVPGVVEAPAPIVQISSFAPQYAEFRAYFWVDMKGPANLGSVRTATMHACLAALKREAITLSCDVSSAVSLAPVELRGEPLRT